MEDFCSQHRIAASAQLVFQLAHVRRRGVVGLLYPGRDMRFQHVDARQQRGLALLVLRFEEGSQFGEARGLGPVGQFALGLELLGVAAGFQQHGTLQRQHVGDEEDAQQHGEPQHQQAERCLEGREPERNGRRRGQGAPVERGEHGDRRDDEQDDDGSEGHGCSPGRMSGAAPRGPRRRWHPVVTRPWPSRRRGAGETDSVLQHGVGRASVGLGQLIQDGRILQRAGVLRDRFALGDGAQQAAHDLAAACLGQVVAEADVLRLGDRADLLGHPVAQLLGDGPGLVARGARALQHHESADGLAGQVVGAAHHGGFGHEVGLGHEGGFDFHRAHAVARDVQYVVDAAGDAEVAAVRTAHRAVARQVVALELVGEVAFLEALRVVPDGADHAGPGALDDQDAARAVGNVVAGFIDDGGGDAGQRQRAGARHQRRGARQRGDDVAAGLGLPEGVHDGAALAAHVLVVPHPGLGVDGLAHAAQDAQARQVGAGRVHRLVGFGRLDERADGRGRGVEDRDLVALDHLPEAAGVRVGGNALEHDLRGAGGERAVGHVGVAGDPADVGRAPEDVLRLQVEGPVHGELGPQEVAARGMLHALGLAGRTAGVEDEERMLRADRHGRALGALAGQGLVEGLVAARHHVAGRGRALEDEDAADRFAAAHGDAFIDDGLERQFLAAAHLVVGGDHGHRARVDDALLQRLGREAAEHHAVRGADARASLHGDHALDGHGHVDQHAVALLHALGLKGVGEAADALQQLPVGDLRHGAVVGLEDDRGLVLDRRADVAVQAVGAGVEFAVGEPLEERGVGPVERAGEGPGPLHVLARQARPEAFEITFGLGAQGLVAGHAGDARTLLAGSGRGEDAVFHQHGFDRGR